jgi:ATP-dependent Clp protease protease subunit
MDHSPRIFNLLEAEAKAGRIYWHSTLDDDLGFWIACHLDRCERDGNIDCVVIDINTSGGGGPEMWQIIDRIRGMETPVNTIASGWAMSSGFMVLAAGRHRRCYPHSSLLFHGAWHGVNRCKTPDLGDEAEAAALFDQAMCEFLGQVTRKRASHWEKIVASNRDRYVTPEEALEWGVIDEIIGG